MNMPISGVNTGAVRSLTVAEKAPGASGAQQPEAAAKSRRLKPAMDEYVPEQSREPSGRYWMGKDEEGQPKLYVDDPQRAADTPKQPEGAPNAKEPEAPKARQPEQADRGAKGPAGKKDREEVWEGNTDKVDREIERLKKQQQQLEQRLSTETDEARRRQLERQLSQVARELGQKDNDSYRRQHTQVTRIS